MEKNGSNAIMILIDNSDISINGDFYPNRLSAQCTAAERLIHFYIKNSDVWLALMFEYFKLKLVTSSSIPIVNSGLGLSNMS